MSFTPSTGDTIHSLHHLGSTGLLQQARELLLLCLQIRVSTDVLLLDEDVRDGTLAGYLVESVLHCSTIVYIDVVSASAR